MMQSDRGSGVLIYDVLQSDRGSGVLIYAVGDDNHVIASVHGGVVKASVGFPGEVVLEAELGTDTGDYR